MDIKQNSKNSVSFIYTILLIVYIPVLFYVRNFELNLFIGYILPISYLVMLNAFLWYFVIFSKSFINRSSKILIILVTISLAIAVAVSGSGSERALSLITFLLSLMFYHLYPMTKQEVDSLLFATILAVAFVLADNLLDANINRNTSGFIISMLMCICSVRYFCKKDVFSFSIIVIGLLLQFYFGSRTAIMGWFMFALMCFLLKASKKSFTSKKLFRIILIIAILGIIFVWFYSEVLYANIGRGKIIIFGKDLFTGRENIWHLTFESVKNHFWFGAGSQVNADYIALGYDEVYSNAHNQPLGLIASFGIMAFALFYITLSNIYKELYRNKKKCSRFPAIFIIVICLMSYLETYLFVQLQWITIVIAYSQIFNYSEKIKEWIKSAE